MPPLYGVDTKWDEAPDWLPRYDFVVKHAPASTVPAQLRAHGALAEEAQSSGIVHYQCAPPHAPDADAGVPVPPQKRWRLWPRAARQSVFYTRFFYREGGRAHECTRAELCAAFRKLVGLFQELTSLAQAIYSVWDVWQFVGRNKAARTPRPHKRRAYEARFLPRVRDAAAAWRPIRWRLFWEAEYMGQYLAHLSDMEDAGRVPRVFRQYPRETVEVGRDVHPPESMFNYRVRLRLQGGEIDDYAFRAAKRINAPQEAEEVGAIRDHLMKLLTDLLEAKGYDAKKEIRDGCHRSSHFRYIRPDKEKVTDTRIYWGLTSNPPPSDYEGRFKSWRYWEYDPVYLASARRPISAHRMFRTRQTKPRDEHEAVKTSPPPPPYESLPPAECSKRSASPVRRAP